MRTRSAAVELTWNGAAVKSKMLGQTTEITYTDPASGEADSLDISIHDRDRQWTVAWLPLEGDTLEAAIKLSNWEREDDNRALPAGFHPGQLRFYRVADHGDYFRRVRSGGRSLSGNRADKDLGESHGPGDRKRDSQPGRNCPGLGCGGDAVHDPIH